MYEMMVGLKIKNPELYSDYRKAMLPLLRKHGGGFRFDFNVSKTLISNNGQDINRVFAIYFKDQKNMELFFNHPEYKQIKLSYFEKSVEETTIISEYEIEL